MKLNEQDVLGSVAAKHVEEVTAAGSIYQREGKRLKVAALSMLHIQQLGDTWFLSQSRSKKLGFMSKGLVWSSV